jgi:hypothetical protein
MIRPPVRLVVSAVRAGGRRNAVKGFAGVARGGQSLLVLCSKSLGRGADLREEPVRLLLPDRWLCGASMYRLYDLVCWVERE